MTSIRHAPLLLLAILSLGCEPENTFLSVAARGQLVGSAFLDANGNGIRESGEGPLFGVRLLLTPGEVGQPLATATSDPEGRFRLMDMPVGYYALSVDPISVADTLRAGSIEPPFIRIRPGDTTGVMVALTYPTLSLEQVRSMPAGRRIFVDGTALNNRTAFADGSVHITDNAHALRLIGLRPGPLLAGHSGRFRGVTDRREGQPVLDDVLAFVVDSLTVPAPRPVSTAQAASAHGGELDATLVKVTGARVLSASSSTGEYRFQLDDGSGIVEAGVGLDRGFDLALLAVGSEISLTGLLAPVPGAPRWRIRPRDPADVSLGYPTATIAATRMLPPGQTVIIVGTALNGRDVFVDSTVHIADATGSIRGTSPAPGAIRAGDRARFLGTTGRVDGQPVLENIVPFVLDATALPAPIRLTTGSAASASQGVFDAALVQVRVVTITGNQRIGSLLIASADDGSGPLEIVVRTDRDFNLDRFAPQSVLDVTGLLSPVPGGGRWRLQPRTSSDVLVAP